MNIDVILESMVSFSSLFLTSTIFLYTASTNLKCNCLLRISCPIRSEVVLDVKPLVVKKFEQTFGEEYKVGEDNEI